MPISSRLAAPGRIPCGRRHDLPTASTVRTAGAAVLGVALLLHDPLAHATNAADGGAPTHTVAAAADLHEAPDSTATADVSGTPSPTAAADVSDAPDPSAVADAADSPRSISEVTVSARRRTENAQDVPIPIAALSGDALEQAGQFRLESLNQSLPSTNIEYSNPRQTSIAVRGLGNNPANDALESSVGVYIDNVYLGRSSMANLDLTDIDQIALLRGPQGTLFGKNTTAGVLNITTREPSFQPQGNVEASYGNYDSYQVRGTWSQPLVDDELAGRLSFSHTTQGGFVHDIATGHDLNGSDRSSGRGQLLWKPNADFSLRLIGDYSEEHSDTGAAVLYNPGPNNGAKYYAAVAAAGATVVYDPNYETTTINGRQHMDVRQGGGSAEANWQLGGGYSITSITAYRWWWFNPGNDADGTNLSAFTNAGQKVDDNQWTQELRLASPADRTLSYVVGLYYFNQHQDNLLTTQYGPDAVAIQDLALGARSFANGYSQTVQYLKTGSEAAFGQLTWKPWQSWEFALGLRDTQESKNVSLYRSSTGEAAFVNNPSFAAYSSGLLSRNDNTISALLSVSYQFTPNVLGYWSLSRGAKAGGINPTAPVPGLTLNSLYVAPEVATDTELGVKSTLLDRRLLLNANLFWTEVKDYQATLLLQPPAGGSFLQVLSNIGKVRTRGVETDVSAVPLDGLTLKLSASYDDAVYLSYHDAPCPAEALAPENLAPASKVCDLTGQQLVGAPSWIANPSASFVHPLLGGLTGTAYASFSWRSSFFGSADNSEYARVPSYGLLDLRYTVAGKLGSSAWQLSLWSNNALDKRYVIGGLTAASSLYSYSEIPGLPRTFGATVHFDF
jgi:iron complex outermembrane recepter protein